MRMLRKSSRKKLKKHKIARQNLSQIVDLVESFETVPYTPRNSLKKCIFGPIKVSAPFHTIFIIISIIK